MDNNPYLPHAAVFETTMVALVLVSNSIHPEPVVGKSPLLWDGAGVTTGFSQLALARLPQVPILLTSLSREVEQMEEMHANFPGTKPDPQLCCLAG